MWILVIAVIVLVLTIICLQVATQTNQENYTDCLESPFGNIRCYNFNPFVYPLWPWNYFY